ncbi:two-component system, sensor histidine kinase RegB [Verrucomicrobium sp. GAS474]|uniref:ATP-binding protein n=1 Tax=Verrucomicrobium sp. GAS474 TaxID=1882831 RepID=UPI00087A41BB|nr:ATP-binding protein [Verrucomicrobium sp. GAS474]SDU16804.1 two-component system, sensor histidine kinase RegB [Verrucomicrobium sp. GAS474]
MVSGTPIESQKFALDGLLRLRWVAVIGQIAACLVARLVFKIELPVVTLAAGIVLTVVTNAGVIAMSLRRSPLEESTSRLVCGALLLLDTATLTAMLYVTGGIHNPFATFFLLHLTIAAILLPPLWTWIGVSLSGVGSVLLYYSPSLLRTTSGQILISDPDFFLYGNISGLVLTGACITYFVTRLSADLRRHEAELARARAISERGERFAALATLAAGVAHELATPLGTIAVASSELEYLAKENKPGEEILPDARLIRNEVERCRHILEKLNDKTMSSLGESPAPVALGKIPELLPSYLKASSRGQVAYEISVEARNLRLVISEEALLQSLAVLVNNGAEAVAVAGNRSPEPGVVVRIEREGGHVSFIVRDEGCGMDVETVRRVGEPFFTTKAPGLGMGLGLFLVRAFAEKARGTFRVESVRGQGTAVFLSIPLDL